MTLKLSEIFVSEAGKYTYSAAELHKLELRPAFLRAMASGFNLLYINNPTSDINLCFAENKEVRPEYRMTFGKVEVIKYIFTQLASEFVDLKLDEV